MNAKPTMIKLYIRQLNQYNCIPELEKSSRKFAEYLKNEEKGNNNRNLVNVNGIIRLTDDKLLKVMKN